MHAILSPASLPDYKACADRGVHLLCVCLVAGRNVGGFNVSNVSVLYLYPTIISHVSSQVLSVRLHPIQGW